MSSVTESTPVTVTSSLPGVTNASPPLAAEVGEPQTTLPQESVAVQSPPPDIDQIDSGSDPAVSPQTGPMSPTPPPPVQQGVNASKPDLTSTPEAPPAAPGKASESEGGIFSSITGFLGSAMSKFGSVLGAPGRWFMGSNGGRIALGTAGLTLTFLSVVPFLHSIAGVVGLALSFSSLLGAITAKDFNLRDVVLAVFACLAFAAGMFFPGIGSLGGIFLMSVAINGFGKSIPKTPTSLRRSPQGQEIDQLLDNMKAGRGRTLELHPTLR
ncbi:MAG: hypothetical protein R3C68_11070 [Myxococcota bacterium]